MRTGDRGKLDAETGKILVTGRIEGGRDVKVNGARVNLDGVGAGIGNQCCAVLVEELGWVGEFRSERALRETSKLATDLAKWLQT